MADSRRAARFHRNELITMITDLGRADGALSPGQYFLDEDGIVIRN